MQSRTICLAAVALLAGCGGGAPKSDPDQITALLKDAARAVADRDGAKACAYLTPEAQQQVVSVFGTAFGGLDCANVVKLATATLAPLDRKQIEDAQPQNIAVTGATATADVALPQASQVQATAPLHLTLQKGAGGWQIASLSR